MGLSKKSKRIPKQIVAKSADVETASAGAIAAGAGAMGAGAVGAFALGALAIGGTALGLLGIGKLIVKWAELDEVRIGRLEVDELWIGGQRVTPPPTPPA